jgi:hypothetical protein
MRRLLTALATALALFSAAGNSRAGDGAESALRNNSSAPAAELLYLDQPHWREADRERKVALAIDFMRIFCGNPAMPPSNLVTCLDEAGDSGSIFESALSCVATDPARPRP